MEDGADSDSDTQMQQSFVPPFLGGRMTERYIRRYRLLHAVL